MAGGVVTMVSGLINANPTIYEKKERRSRIASRDVDESAVELIDEQEIFDHIRDIKDPEHPYSLEQLKVITEDAIEVDDKESRVRVTFTRTVEHCSMATVIGLSLRVKLMRSLPPRFKPESPAQFGGKIYEMMSMALLGKWGTYNDGFQQQVNPASYIPEAVEAEVVEPTEAGGNK